MLPPLDHEKFGHVPISGAVAMLTTTVNLGDTLWLNRQIAVFAALAVFMLEIVHAAAFGLGLVAQLFRRANHGFRSSKLLFIAMVGLTAAIHTWTPLGAQQRRLWQLLRIVNRGSPALALNANEGVISSCD